jgi:hypothetical protein
VNRTFVLCTLLLLSLACSHDSNPTTVFPVQCTLPVPAGTSLAGAQVIELGTHLVNDTLTFDVPPNTGSITIVEQAAGNVPLTTVFVQSDAGSFSTDNSAVPRFVFFPDGGVAYDDFNSAGPDDGNGTSDPSTIYINFGQDSPVTASFTFPNTAASLTQPLAAGTWKFVVSDFALECTQTQCIDGGTNQDRYDVKVLLRPATGGSSLDVSFFLVGAATNPLTRQALTAANAPTDTFIQRMLSSYAGIFAKAGITVRNVSYVDVSPADRASFANITVSDQSGQGPCDQLDQMFAKLTAGRAGSSMNLFLVNQITDASPNGAGPTVGVDGTIPGPGGFDGTVHSGAAVSMADLYSGSCSGTQLDLPFCGADEVAYISAHETGHYLGLFHTTEINGGLVDPLIDTPKCDCKVCAAQADQPNCGGSSAPSMLGALCNGDVKPACGGADNLMFWILDPDLSKGTLSGQQGQVMRLNPLIQ